MYTESSSRKSIKGCYPPLILLVPGEVWSPCRALHRFEGGCIVIAVFFIPVIFLFLVFMIMTQAHLSPQRIMSFPPTSVLAHRARAPCVIPNSHHVALCCCSCCCLSYSMLMGGTLCNNLLIGGKIRGACRQTIKQIAHISRVPGITTITRSFSRRLPLIEGVVQADGTAFSSGILLGVRGTEMKNDWIRGSRILRLRNQSNGTHL